MKYCKKQNKFNKCFQEPGLAEYITVIIIMRGYVVPVYTFEICSISISGSQDLED